MESWGPIEHCFLHVGGCVEHAYDVRQPSTQTLGPGEQMFSVSVKSMSVSPLASVWLVEMFSLARVFLGGALIEGCSEESLFWFAWVVWLEYNQRAFEGKEPLKKVLIGTYASVFDFCAGRCRHNSDSVIHENAYLSDFHHCFSLPSNFSGGRITLLESKLAGINVFVGRQGASCDSVCKFHGLSCVPNKLFLLNQCEIMQKYMSCKGSCLASMGSDQPAEVVDDAPTQLNPGACLYTQSQTMLSCDGSHRYTRRLCPCA